MKRHHINKRGHILRDAQERRKLIDSYKTSGQSKADFCRKHGIKLSTFGYWISKEKGVKGFKEIVLPVREPDGIEIELPGGLRVKMAGKYEVGELARFVKELGRC